MSDEWFYVADRKKVGPVTLAQLQQLAASGQIKPADMVLQGGTTKWAAAETVAGLFQPAPDALPPAPDEDELQETRAGFAEIMDTAPPRIKPHQGSVVFLMGILSLAAGLVSLFGQCCFFGISFLNNFYQMLIPLPVLALGLGGSVWLKGGQHLQQMKANHMDPAGESQTRMGWIFGIIGTILGIIGILMYLTIVLVVGASRTSD